MKIIRCNHESIVYALEAIRVVKNEEDNNPIELVTEDVLVGFLKNTDNYLIVAVEHAKVLGFIIAYELQRVDRNSSIMFLYEIGVLKELRNRGIGTELIDFLKRICEERSIMKMWVPTERTNISAVNLYTKTGGIISKVEDEVSFTWYPPFR